MSQNTTDQVLQVFIDTNKDLKSQVKNKEKEISKLKSVIENKDKLIQKTNIHIPALEPSRYQAIVKLKPQPDNKIVDKDIENNKDEEDMFIGATYLYAEFLGYKDQFDIINKHYIEVIHPDEYERIKTLTVEDMKNYIYLKLKTKKNESKWVKSHSRMIEFNDGLIIVTDIIPIEEEEYLKNVMDSFDSGVMGEG